MRGNDIFIAVSQCGGTWKKHEVKLDYFSLKTTVVIWINQFSEIKQNGSWPTKSIFWHSYIACRALNLETIHAFTVCIRTSKNENQVRFCPFVLQEMQAILTMQTSLRKIYIVSHKKIPSIEMRPFVVNVGSYTFGNLLYLLKRTAIQKCEITNSPVRVRMMQLTTEQRVFVKKEPFINLGEIVLLFAVLCYLGSYNYFAIHSIKIPEVSHVQNKRSDFNGVYIFGTPCIYRTYEESGYTIYIYGYTRA